MGQCDSDALRSGLHAVMISKRIHMTSPPSSSKKHNLDDVLKTRCCASSLYVYYTEQHNEQLFLN